MSKPRISTNLQTLVASLLFIAKEAKGALKTALKGTDAPRGSNQGIESGGKGIGNSLGSQDQGRLGKGESRGERVIQKPQRYRD
jgi:hypothetical protein